MVERRPVGPHLAALVAVSVALPYLPGAFRNGFVWLDTPEIVEGMLIVDNWRDVLALFLNDRNYAGYDRPVYSLLHSLDRALWGLEPAGFYATSMALHVANVLLVRIVRTKGLRSLPARQGNLKDVCEPRIAVRRGAQTGSISMH